MMVLSWSVNSLRPQCAPATSGVIVKQQGLRWLLISRPPRQISAKNYLSTLWPHTEKQSEESLMTIEFNIPPKPTIELIDPDRSIARDLRKAGISPPPLHRRKGEPQENFPENLPRRRRRRDQELPKLSLKPPHTKFAVIPSRAITDPRINTRKPLLLLLGAIGIHASVHGICYPSQRRLALLCGKSHSWACKYLHELIRMGYVRRLVPPTKRGARQALRLQVMWSTTQPLPAKEIAWEKAPWCWR